MRRNLLYIDLFCGAGGTSTGVENARIDDMKCAKVIACVNHDKNAIASHAANHPDALHFTEDIRTLDLAPPYLITTEDGIGIEVYDTDSKMTIKIKEFMAMYGIIDIKMRMLNIGELKRIMGFPSDYILVGTQAEQKKYIGNAVEVNMARVLCEAIARELKRHQLFLL